MTIWKDIPGYPHYMASDDGRIFSKYKNKVMSCKPNIKTGYPMVMLCENGKRKQLLVHRLIAKTFLDNPDNLPCVNHKDESRDNNAVSNLEWCTYSYNASYGDAINKRMAHWTIEELRKSQMNAAEHRKRGVVNLTTGIAYESTADASRKTGIHNTSITSACVGRYKTAGGCKWAYQSS